MRLAALCAVCMLPVALLRRTAPEQALLLTTAILAAALARCLCLAAPVLEAQVFDLTRAVARGDYDRASELLGSLLKLQEEPVMLLALLGKELRRLYTARVALDTGRDKFWVMEQWNIRFESVARQLLDNARRVDQRWCAGAVRRCYEADVRMKSVNGVSGAEELKLLLMELAQGAAK